jgi:hypothetical protein
MKGIMLLSKYINIQTALFGSAMLILDSVVGLAREARASLLGAPGLRELGGARGGEHRGARYVYIIRQEPRIE